MCPDHGDRSRMIPESCLFNERRAAARSLKNGWTRLASTYSCMEIVLTGEQLIIRPHRLACLLIRLLCLDLVHRIPLARIQGVVELGRWSKYGMVEIHFTTIEGDSRKIILYLKDDQRFVEVLRQQLS